MKRGARWTQRDDMLLVAHLMAIGEVADLLGRSEAECHQRLVALGLETGEAAAVNGHRGTEVTIRLHDSLAAELEQLAAVGGEPVASLCRRLVREGVATGIRPVPPPAIRRGLRGAIPCEDAEEAGRRVTLCLGAGQREAAHRAIDECWQRHHGQSDVAPDDHLGGFLADVRLLGILERGGIETVGQLASASHERLQRVPRIGPAQLATLVRLAAGLRVRLQTTAQGATFHGDDD